MNKKLLTAALVLVTAGGVYLGATQVSAMGWGFGSERHDELVTEFSERFGLDKTEVEDFFEQHHEEMEIGHQEVFVSRLDQAVADGKITAEQKQLIFGKLDELKAERENNREVLQNMSLEERKTAVDQEREALKQWAVDNGIDLNLLRPFGGHGRGHHGMMGWIK